MGGWPGVNLDVWKLLCECIDETRGNGEQVNVRMATQSLPSQGPWHERSPCLPGCRAPPMVPVLLQRGTVLHTPGSRGTQGPVKSLPPERLWGRACPQVLQDFKVEIPRYLASRSCEEVEPCVLLASGSGCPRSVSAMLHPL